MRTYTATDCRRSQCSSSSWHPSFIMVKHDNKETRQTERRDKETDTIMDMSQKLTNLAVMLMSNQQQKTIHHEQFRKLTVIGNNWTVKKINTF